jgi:hypothetical protein
MSGMVNIEVTQSDRIAAGNYALDNSVIRTAEYEPIIKGRADHSALVQAFARHRIQSQTERLELREALREARSLIRGHPDVSLSGSDHWVWEQAASALLARIDGSDHA